MTTYLNPRMYMYKWGRGGGGWMPPPHKVFLSFLLDDKTSVPDILSSFETSLVMVSYYGYEIWHHK